MMLVFLTGALISMHISEEAVVSLEYLGHSCFLITFDNDIIVLTDYGKPNAWEEYGWDSPIRELGDKNPHIATYSHRHEDHYDSTRLPETGIIRYFGGEALQYKDVRIESIPMSEGVSGTPDNFGYLMTYKDIKVLHMGDCQANMIGCKDPLNSFWLSEQLPKDCDIVLFPIEGQSKYMDDALRFIEYFHARVYVPMHFWSLDYRNEFVSKASEDGGFLVRQIDSSEKGYTYSKNDVYPESLIVVFD